MLSNSPTKAEVLHRVDELLTTSGKSMTVKSIRNSIFEYPRDEPRSKSKMIRDALSELSYKVSKQGRGNRKRYCIKEMMI